MSTEKREKICMLFPYEGRNKKIFAKDCLDDLKGAGSLFILNDKEKPVGEFCRDADVIVTTWGSPALDASVLETAPALKFICHAAGTVKPYVDSELMRRGVRVSSASNILGRNVAITTFGFILAAVKKIFWWNDFIKTGKGWGDNTKMMQYTDEIGGVNTGVIGMSNVGRNLVSLLAGVTENILVYDPYCSAGEIWHSAGARKVEDIYEIAERCEVIALCAPLLKETEGMLGRKFFQGMKDGAVFINPSRGAIIDEAALVEELEKERIFACLDVTDPEPPSGESPLRQLKNVVMSPHIAGCVNSGLGQIGRFCVEEIKRFLEGKELRNEIKLEKLDITA